jgi:hypothetical protein
MNKLEDALDKIAESIRCLDEASLTSLWEKYRAKVEDFSFTPQWEKAVIIFSIIESVHVKNSIFNLEMLKKEPSGRPAPAKKKATKPNLRLVK